MSKPTEGEDEGSWSAGGVHAGGRELPMGKGESLLQFECGNRGEKLAHFRGLFVTFLKVWSVAIQSGNLWKSKGKTREPSAYPTVEFKIFVAVTFHWLISWKERGGYLNVGERLL